MRTTPPPLVDVGVEIPELRDRAVVTTRLHPRLGETEELGASKLGGKILWPEDEPWPVCPEHDAPLVAALQLRKTDVPDMPFPEGTDLFQLLWCPNEHGEMEPEEMFAHRVFWRAANEIKQPLAKIPRPDEIDEGYEPLPCVLHPERVTEYPHIRSLPEELEEKVEEVLEPLVEQTEKWDIDEPLAIYAYLLSVADGTKVGGHVNWIQDDETPECECGREMEHLLTVASLEFDGGTYPRWCPQEEADVWDGPPEERFRAQSAAELMFGDGGNLYFFVCRHCRPWRVASVMQCS
jgi:hypothetical protein